CTHEINANNPDSQKRLYKEAKSEKRQLELLHRIVDTYLYKKNDSAELYCKIGMRIAEKESYLKYRGEFLNYLGVIYYERGEYSKALQFYFSSEKVIEPLKDTNRTISAMTNIGHVYELQGLEENAIKQYNIAIKLCVNKKLDAKKAEIFTHLGSAYYSNGDKIKAKDYFEKALIIFKIIKDDFRISEALSNLGVVYQDMGSFDLAELNFQEHLNYAKKLNESHSLIIAYFNLANLFQTQKFWDKALCFLDSSAWLAEKTKDYENLIEIYSAYSDIYKEKKNFEKALAFQILMDANKDTMLVRNKDKLIIEMATRYDTEKKEKENEILRVEGKMHRAFAIGSIAGLILLVLILFFIFNSYRIKKKANAILQKQNISISEQKKLIEEKATELAVKHKEITDSINYAERIQRSFLASDELLSQNLQDYFVFFQPKDVVSGDFYWASILSNGNFAYVCADSTGHGVPGAIMSILNISSLELAIRERLNQPSEILNYARKEIINRLKKDGSAEGGKDGMDASLIVLNEQKTKLVYAAANNPVWVIRKNNNGQTEFIEAKPDKMPVGKHERDNLTFTQHEIELQKGDTIYSLTDGMPDQFGGPRGKKYKYTQLKEFLISIADLNMQEQHQKLKSEFESWKGNLEQIDDVCLIGIRI
ncbi:MAG: tetratricopeptide repeat protein, partial [Bacteroidota bacterium]